MDGRLLVDSSGALRALEHLQEDAPRVISNELTNLAQDAAGQARAKAPGRLAATVRVVDAAIAIGRGIVGAVVVVDDQAVYGEGMRVGRWTNYGTRGNADRRAVKEPGRRASREPGTGIKPQRWLRKVSVAKQKRAIEIALVRTARRLGFDVKGGAS